MKEILRNASLIFNTFFIIFTGCSMGAESREPHHAGTFYPADREELRRMLDYMLGMVKIDVAGKPDAIIVPHAGYVYSGQTAAYSFSALKGRDIRRVILLATSHYAYFEGVVINEKPYRTPLGIYGIDTEALRILKSENFDQVKNDIASTMEHSDEVEIPFLQMVLPNAKLVPLIVGNLSDESFKATARALIKIIDDRTVIVVSSDFTHYGERFQFNPGFGAKSIKDGVTELDGRAIGFITNRDSAGFLNYVKKTGATICGVYPITLLLRTLEEENYSHKGNLLKYAMSGDMTGEYDGGVSYAAIIFGDIKSITEREEKKPSIDNKVISDEEEKTLLGLARFVLNSFVSSGVTNYPGAKPGGFTITDRMKQRLGAFVTLNKSDQLRGCIGYITGRKMLYEAVIDNTVNAAASDPRFSPVTKEELKDIDIEISVITPLIKVESIDEIQIGRDGLYLVNGNNTGVFLPQVPLEWNWDRKTYLEELGLKAGLTREAYRDKATILYRFSAQVFGEK